MLKRIFAAAAAASFILAGTAAAAQPQGHPRPPAPGVHVISLHRAYQARLGHTRPGKISGIVYPRGTRHRARGTTARGTAACAEPNCPLTYNGGSVQHTPHVYLLLWGPKWSSDSGHEASAAYLETFYQGLGVQPQDIWSTNTTQYPDGTGAPAFAKTVFRGAFLDTSAPPSGASQAQLAAEADAFASSVDITDLADAQIVVATQSGTCPAGFAGTGCPSGGSAPYCAYHSSSSEPYVNLPYQLDAGASCGENFVNAGGTNDGWSIVGGHEYAEAITDPFPPAGWIDTADSSGGETADKCAWRSPATDIALSTGSFAMQSLWSNTAGGCAMASVPKDTVGITSPGTQSGFVGWSVSLQLSGSSSGGYLITWRARGLPAGLAVDSRTGLITGTFSTAATYSVTVTAVDETGAARSLAFSWTVSPTPGNPITGDHGKCLDDFGSSTANGNKVDIWSCNTTGAQKWTFSGGALSVLGKCLDDQSQGGAGSKLVIWTCNGHKSQTWSHHSNGEYVLKLNGLCLTDPSGSSADGTQVVIRACRALNDQKWTLP